MQLVAWPLGLNGYAAGILLAQWAAFFPSYLARTEQFYDLTGSLTYIATVIASRSLSPAREGRQLVATLFILVWALRLGLFLFTRVLRVGKDSRFDAVKDQALPFLQFWTVQGLWVFLCSLPVLILNAKEKGEERAAWPGPTDAAGITLYLLGITTEVTRPTHALMHRCLTSRWKAFRPTGKVDDTRTHTHKQMVADLQKEAFLNDSRNRGKFIDVGLWRHSRHPNYCGEIMLWCGIFLLASGSFTRGRWVGNGSADRPPTVSSWEHDRCRRRSDRLSFQLAPPRPSTAWDWLALLCPAFVILLLTRVSVPMTEKGANKRWGEEKEYKAYMQRTPAVFPFLP